MHTVTRYQIRVPGTDPAQHRATISLLGGGTMRSALGHMHFYDIGKEIPPDAEDDDLIIMHLPITVFAGIVAVLQHDKPVKLEFERGRGHLWTAEWEPVGETEGR